MTLSNVVYLLCALTSLICGVLLARGYRRSRSRLLYWSCLCFFGLCLNNLFLFFDLAIVPTIDLSIVRELPALVGIALLLFGLIWFGDR
jgi:multidrug transporter EmrE-like cation transporter